MLPADDLLHRPCIPDAHDATKLVPNETLMET
jgi:hypothetical protein